MKATWKRVIALILVLVMAQVQGISVRAEANKSNQNTSSVITETYINPLYADEIRESDLASPDEASAIATYANEEYTDSVEEAGAKIREGMKQREESIVIYFQAPEYSKELLVEIANQALVHTGNPTEGDYLRWQYGSWTSSTSYYTKDSTDYMTITYTYTYYTTSEQEAAVDEKVDEVLTDLDVTNKNDYQKIRATYDYICEHTVYDYDNLEDDEYKLKYTAYAALIDGKAVCQGYALLFYRLALELGVDSRLISGTGNGGAHGWNITELNDVYYNLDTTWDAGESEYSYFLKCDANFKGHERDEEYATEEFYASYPMAEEDYVIPEICEPGQHQYEASFEWTEITDEKGNGTGQYSATATLTCTVCGDEVGNLEAEVAYDEENSIPATCEQAGQDSYIATVTYEEKTYTGEKEVEIPVADHTWEEEYTVDKEATCEEAGSESIHCSVCGAIQEESVQKIPATGHNFGEWVITKEPTEQEEGLQERACQNQGCSKKETETIPKLATVSVQYRTHVQTYSWEEEWRSDGDLSGTEGQAKRLEAIQIQLKDQKYTGDIVYKTHVQTYGWQSEVKNGTTSGTEGKAKRLEAIKIYLTGEMAEKYDVYYCVHAQTYGWLGWAKNGEYAGTAGLSKRLEGIKIVLVEKGGKEPQQEGNTDAAYVTANSASGEKSTNYVTYRTHVQTIGWQDWKYDGVMSGTEGQSKRLEGIEIQLADNLNTDEKYEGDIEYQTHIQGYGWEEDWKGTWAKNGALSGTESQSRRLEAICIRLTGEMEAHFDVYYRVHAQTFGWLGWAKNGAEAGTAGYGKRLEGIEIVLVEKNGKAPGDTANAFKEK
ncbi:transglutaminase domain-containing protein [Floccifex porci]|uniref:Transglutaminase-like domain-containing protein n=1 Tax=Floccifex porci TaxID=2606629 RepID=A0A7X2N239_9FIRM|nr:transglutaminase domain-containing protein [Floccifex porci]MSS01075.1 hypothetical protein [Floccifex porci]